MRTILFATLALAACSDDDDSPITKITGPRVLAVTSEPSALVLGGAVELTPVVVDVDGPRTPDAVRYRACAPWKLIADPDRDCTGADALDITASVTTDQLAAAFPAPPGTEAPADPWRFALAAGLELRVPIIAEVDLDGTTLVVRRDLHVVDEQTPRTNPRLAELRFDGAATTALRASTRYQLTATVDPASLDPDPDDMPRTVLERIDVYVYSPTGTLADAEIDVDEPDVAVPETEATTYATGEPGPTWMYVVLTDDTGGMTAEAIALTIE